MVLKDNQYSKIYIKNYKLNVCLSHLLDTGGAGPSKDRRPPQNSSRKKVFNN